MTSFNCSELNKLPNDKINFVKMCKEKFDKSELPAVFDQWTVEQQHDHLTNNVEKYFPNIPASLRYVLPAVFKDGDCGRLANERPDWLDMDKFRRGQDFVQRYFAGILVAQMISMFQLFTLDDSLRAVIFSQKSNTLYHTFKRYLSTAIRMNHWYLEDPWDHRTQAYRDVQVVRKMHRVTRRRLCSYDDEPVDANSQILHLSCPMQMTLTEDFRDACPTAKDLQCPFTMTQIKSVNQGEMSAAQFTFVGLIVLHPKKFGLHLVSDEDLDAFCHLWRGLGYLLGIEEQYNLCRGSLQDVRRRCGDLVEHWLKPNLHMSKCVHEGLSYYIPMVSYKVYLLYLCDILDMKMPRLYKSLSLLENAMYVLYKFVFDYLTTIPFVVDILNTFMRTCLNLAEKFGPVRHPKLRKKSRITESFGKLYDVLRRIIR